MNQDIFSKAIVPSVEIGSYEMLWLEDKAWFNKIADKFKSIDGTSVLPSELVHDTEQAQVLYAQIMDRVSKSSLKNFGVRFRETLDYPDKLNDAKDPVQMLYFAGNWGLVYSKSVSIVGTRNPTIEGLKRTEKLAKEFVKNGFTIVSGLASGVDTQAHTTAINEGGNTIAVVGTPLDITYPKENTKLFHEIMKNHLVISQIPFIKYANQTFQSKRFYFPERNKTMSALSEATIIVEAGETSGTLIQARAALEQGRKLFILASCFERGLIWPQKYLEKGAFKVHSFEDIWKNLENYDSNNIVNRIKPSYLELKIDSEHGKLF